MRAEEFSGDTQSGHKAQTEVRMGKGRYKVKPEDCPIGLDKVHCDNCYFWRDGKCDYDAIMREHNRSSKEVTKRAAEDTTSSPWNQKLAPFSGC